MKIKQIWDKYTLTHGDESLDFFEAGGDSLSAINMIVEIGKEYQVDISLESFMRNPSIQFLSQSVANVK